MLNKADFIERLANKGYTKKDADSIMNDFIDTVTEILAEGESVQFYGFGTFDVRRTSERESVDFQTKQRIIIPGHKAPKFVPGAKLKRIVKEGFVRE